MHSKIRASIVVHTHERTALAHTHAFTHSEVWTRTHTNPLIHSLDSQLIRNTQKKNSYYFIFLSICSTAGFSLICLYIQLLWWTDKLGVCIYVTYFRNSFVLFFISLVCLFGRRRFFVCRIVSAAHNRGLITFRCGRLESSGRCDSNN